MTDKTPIVGLSGTLGSFTLGNINDMLGIACGILTLIYIGFKLYGELRR